MPTAEEWSAIFGATAFIALWFAWYQIKQVDSSNKELVAANDAARLVNLETIRPRVQVALSPFRAVSKTRGQPARGALHIELTNTGTSPARNLRLTVDPPFTSLPKFFKPGLMDDHLVEINRFFKGSVVFHDLNPGVPYLWYLGEVPDLFDDSTGPRTYRVTAEYEASTTSQPYVDVFVLDFDVEKKREVAIDPLIRIGRDLEVVGDRLATIAKAIPREANHIGEEALFADDAEGPAAGKRARSFRRVSRRSAVRYRQR
jgi:hypothetical protein